MSAERKWLWVIRKGTRRGKGRYFYLKHDGGTSWVAEWSPLQCLADAYVSWHDVKRDARKHGGRPVKVRARQQPAVTS